MNEPESTPASEDPVNKTEINSTAGRTWNKYFKPPATICPEKYCFHWVAAGGFKDMSGIVHSSLKQALDAFAQWQEFPHGGCGCSFGVCRRLAPDTGDHDWYEPNEPELKKSGLPWFYFIPSTDKLVEECHEEYQRESRALWGENHSSE